MKKRALSLILASVCAAAVMSCGCGGVSSDSIIILDSVDRTKTTTVSVFGNRADHYSLRVIENTLQGFMSDNLIATYESATTNYWQALDKRYETDNLDDVFAIEHDRLMKMSADNALADLSDIVNANNFNEFARNQLYGANGAVYAIPTAVSTYGLYVNYDLLKKYNQSIPSKLDEFTAVCEYFKDSVTPVICNNSSSLRSLILAVGMYDTYRNADTAGEIEKFNAKPSLLSEKLNAGIDFVYRMAANGWIDLNESASLSQCSGDLGLFLSGERPFMITGGWASDTIKDMTGGKALSYGIHAYPVLKEGSVLVAETDMLSVKKGENESRAKELVARLTSASSLLALNENQSRFSPLNTTQIYADATITPSASHLTKGRYVVCGDMRLNIPLDSYLNECTDLILYGHADADTVKARLTSLLGGASDE